MAKNRYCYDLQVFASVSVDAESRDEAKAMIQKSLEGVSIQTPPMPNGETLEYEINAQPELCLLEELEGTEDLAAEGA
jgi:hypothetical protein